MGAQAVVAVVLAAGRGTRMRSDRPKPLHRLCGRAMLLHVLDAVSGLAVARAVVVVGHGAEAVMSEVADHGRGLAVELAHQDVPLGTGDAVAVALAVLPGPEVATHDVVVLPGDAPLVRAETLQALVASHRRDGAAATLLTARVPDPSGYGRVVRESDGSVARIVEEADAGPDEIAIDEVATSVYCFRGALLGPALGRLTTNNVKGERYLTDVVGILNYGGHPVAAVRAEDAAETMGVNDRAQLAEAEAELRRRVNHRWMTLGVAMVDPSHTYVDVGVVLSPDVTLLPGSVLRGATVVHGGAAIGPGTDLDACTVGAEAVICQSVAEGAEVGPGAVVGPYARLGPGAFVPPGLVTGPFYTAPQEGTSGSCDRGAAP